MTFYLLFSTIWPFDVTKGSQRKITYLTDCTFFAFSASIHDSTRILQWKLPRCLELRILPSPLRSGPSISHPSISALISTFQSSTRSQLFILPLAKLRSNMYHRFSLCKLNCSFPFSLLVDRSRYMPTESILLWWIRCISSSPIYDNSRRIYTVEQNVNIYIDCI